jgi:hypothetical protein
LLVKDSMVALAEPLRQVAAAELEKPGMPLLVLVVIVVEAMV